MLRLLQVPLTLFAGLICCGAGLVAVSSGLDKVNCRFKHVVAACSDPLNRGSHGHVGNDARTLGRPVVGIEDSETADHRAQATGKWNERNVTIRTCCRASHDERIRHGTEGHRRVLSLTLGSFINENDDSSFIVNGTWLNQRARYEVECSRVGKITCSENNKRGWSYGEIGTEREGHEFRWIIANIDNEALCSLGLL